MPTGNLFPDAPRRKKRKLMHVVDAGHGPGGGKHIEFECSHCGYNSGWIEDENTVSENKKGIPCPECNKD